jgi:hypothetical protein
MAEPPNVLKVAKAVTVVNIANPMCRVAKGAKQVVLLL